MKALFTKTRSAPQARMIDGVSVIVTRKKVKNLNLAVLPPDGTVKVSVPYFVSAAAVEAFVRSRMEWIQEKRQGFLESTKYKKKDYVDGEVHPFLGVDHVLKIRISSSRRWVEKTPSEITLYARESDCALRREKILEQWYREQLTDLLPQLFAHWEAVVGRSANEWGIKKMKTRWGSCNITARRVWLNLELAKYPLECLEYVLVHELVHLYEASHNARFKGLMSQYLPGWKERKKLLNTL